MQYATDETWGLTEATNQAGRIVATLEPGVYEAGGSFNSKGAGFTVSYGAGFEQARHFATEADAKDWIERRWGD